jgi:V/A-type H+-transporting ATPase subunit C
MRSLARYATTNAITRTMLAELLTREDFEAMARAESVQGVWAALRRTPYGEWVPEDMPPDLPTLEKALREAGAKRFKRSIHALTGKPRDVGRLLLARWELDNLEFALRLWHGGNSGLAGALTFPSPVNDIPIYDIVEAETIEEIALLLRHTPYVEPISRSIGAYREKGSMFFVEVALERDYYRRLLAAVRDLGGSDTRLAERTIGAEIDLLNLSWLMRLTEYHEPEVPRLSDILIPGPGEISRKLGGPGAGRATLEEAARAALGDRIEMGGNGARVDQMALLEVIVRESAAAAARRLLAGYPFSIGCVFAFYILKRMELGNLQSVFAGKFLGSPQTDIVERLSGLR